MEQLLDLFSKWCFNNPYHTEAMMCFNADGSGEVNYFNNATERIEEVFYFENEEDLIIKLLE